MSTVRSLAKHHSTLALTPLFGLPAGEVLKGSNFNQRIKPVLSQLQDINLTSVVLHCFYIAAT